MIRMLIIGSCIGSRSVLRLCDEVYLKRSRRAANGSFSQEWTFAWTP
jgi:hypothetical protein